MIGENTQLIKNGLTRGLRKAALLIIIGLMVSSFALVLSDVSGDYRDISARSTEEVLLGEFSEGEDLQISLRVTENKKQYPGHEEEDAPIETKLVYSRNGDFSDSKTVFSVRFYIVFQDVQTDEGFYKLEITNLTDESNGFFLIETQASTSDALVFVMGLLFIAAGGLVVAVIASIALLLVFALLIKAISEYVVDRRNQKSKHAW